MKTADKVDAAFREAAARVWSGGSNPITNAHESHQRWLDAQTREEQVRQLERRGDTNWANSCRNQTEGRCWN